MASSPIEIAPSHFGCVLRDHNQRIIRERNIDREREGNQAAAALRKNLEEFVRDHFPTCIGLSTTNSENVSSSDENSQPGSEDNNHQREYWGGFNEGRRNNQSFRPIVTNNANKRRQQETVSTECSPTTARTWQSGRIFDRWSTRQPGDDDMVNSNERRRRQTNEAELQALSNSQPVSARASTFMRETSPSASDSSADVPKLRASSLVQMWKEFEAESTVPTGNNQSQSQSAAGTTTKGGGGGGGGGGACNSLNSDPAISTTGRNNSNSTNNSNIEDSYVEDPLVGSSGSNDETYEAVVVVTEDSFPDWESDQTVASCSLSTSQGQFSDTADSERVVRVADIIRRLTSASQPQSPAASVTDEVDRDQSVMSEPLPRDHSLSDQSINGGNTPRVRGRQAFQDLLIQMERERQRELTGLVERHAVSKFSHRGRIQSLLRLRFLQRGAAAEGQQNSTSELNQLQRRTTIFRLRERFSPSVERDGTAVSSREDDVTPRKLSNDTPDSVQTGLLNQEVRPHQKDIATLEQNCPQEQHTMHTINEQLHEEASQSSDVTWEGPSSGAAQNNWREPVNSTDSSHDWEGEVITAEELAQQYVGGSTDSLEEVVAHNNWRKPENVASRWEGEMIIKRKHLGGSTDGWEGVGQLDWQVPVTTAAGSTDSLEGVVAHNNWRKPENAASRWEGEVIIKRKHLGGSTDGWEGVGQLDWQVPVTTAAGSTDSLEGVVAHNNWRKPENAASRWEGEVKIKRKHLGGSTDGWEGVGQLDWQVPVTTAAGSSDSEGEVITAEEPVHETEQHVGESTDRWEGALVTEEPEHPNAQKSVEPASATRQHGVSRPQSDWEGRRKAWYNDMLENNSDNDEIRALFERRTVSTFLSSEQRERMDQMIFSFVRRQRHETTTEYSEEEENQENPIEEHHYTEVSDDTDQVTYTSLQLPLPPQLRSLNQYEHNEVSDLSDQAASTLMQIPQSSQSDNEDSRQSSPFLRQSLEMELIYDLRGYMAQLHHEMTELRKSVQSCMGMQVQLQNSIKEEVSAAVCNSIRGGETKEFFNRQNSMRKNNCCICDEMQVDSLLYRCGHMCTCFKCAQELQWSNGRCPICRAPIVDVVRAYDT